MINAKALKERVRNTLDTISLNLTDELEVEAFRQAGAGNTNLEKDFNLTGQKGMNVTGWDEACYIGEKVIEAFIKQDFNASYKAIMCGKETVLTIKIYWGINPEEEWFPFFEEEEEEE